MNCLRLAEIINITTIYTFKSGNSNINKIESQHCQIMTSITNEILKLKPMIKMKIVTNSICFTAIDFSKIIFFT